jgi:arsenate reductase
LFTLYGLKNCDTCRKARKWLSANHIEYRFHDIRADGLTRERIDGWVAQLGWQAVVNRRSTTWRQIPEAERGDLDAVRAAALMAAHPTLVKRPVIETRATTLIGFSEDTEAALKAANG